MALTRSDDPLVWIDCEMTGLDHTTDRILSISCFITTSSLDLVDTKGYHAVISTPLEILSGMDAWCTETHTRTGLIDQCLHSNVSTDRAAAELLSYIQRLVPKRSAMLAGNSVHVDKLFLLCEPWKGVLEWLHYRILDVSAIKEGVRRWCGDDVLGRAPVKKGVHSALEDVLESIEEARFYRGLFAGLKVEES